ncbi:MAG: ACT domain-containing protein [Nitrospirota bacterium]|nr:ACT domain-containing protein [Nitrospirota bacterium]
MTKIATLGPQGTFSDLAAKSYLHTFGEALGLNGIKYFKSIKSTFKAVGTECDFGVLPIENLSEGYVEVVLDLLVDSDLEIVHELVLPIQFSFVSYAKTLQDIKKIFVQYVAEGQCGNFIDSLPDVTVVRTESNMVSLDLLKKDNVSSGAIVPCHADLAFPSILPNVNDYENNATRFIVLSGKGLVQSPKEEYNCKTSFIVVDDNDYPGLLVRILSPFSSRGLNLTSIISRPAKTSIGRYHFFIDIEGHEADLKVKEAFDEISSLNNVKILGSYPRAHCQ